MIQRLRVVVVAWNSADHLARCLESIGASLWTRGPIEVVVVDNGSTDETVAVARSAAPGALIRPTGHNLGFAGGANAGLHDLDGFDAVVLLNPDAFLEPDALEALARTLDGDQRLGASCPKILLAGTSPPRINNAGNEISSRWEPRDRGLGELDAGQYDAEEDVWGWCGGAVMLTCAYLADVGMFDESLFLYAEDVDLSWRGRARGWRYRYVPTAVVHHVHRASSGGRRTPLLDYLNRRNRLVVVTRHAPKWGVFVAWTRALGGIAAASATTAAAIVLRRGSGDRAGLSRRVQAARHAITLLRGMPVALPAFDEGARETPS